MSKIYNVKVSGCLFERSSIPKSQLLAEFDIEFTKRRAIQEDEVLRAVDERYPFIGQNNTDWDVLEVEYRCNGLLNTARYIHPGYHTEANQHNTNHE